MKKLWDSPVPFLAYGLPYVYLGLWGRGETGRFLANFLYIIGFFTLMKWAYHRNSLKALLWGNALSFLVSCPCTEQKNGASPFLNRQPLSRCCARRR